MVTREEIYPGGLGIEPKASRSQSCFSNLWLPLPRLSKNLLWTAPEARRLRPDWLNSCSRFWNIHAGGEESVTSGHARQKCEKKSQV